MRYLLIFCLSLPLFAHSLKLFTTQEKDYIKIKSYFSASSPCQKCKLIVTTSDKKTIVYQTNTKGEATIPLHVKPIIILVDGGLGHQKSKNLNIKYKEDRLQALPNWLKTFIAFGVIFIFFLGLKWIKRAS